MIVTVQESIEYDCELPGPRERKLQRSCDPMFDPTDKFQVGSKQSVKSKFEA